MSKKQINASEKTTNKKLSALERKLLKFMKAGQPVLLFGPDTYGREDLIKKVNLLSGGIANMLIKTTFFTIHPPS